MPVYVAEIAGRAIFAFDADDEGNASARVSDKAFVHDLHVLQHGGRSLWDGSAEICLRSARPEEAAVWQADHDAGGQNAKSPWRVFLLPVIDPSKFDDDKDDQDHPDFD